MSRKKTLLNFALWSSLVLFCGMAATFAGIFLYLSPGLPNVSALREIEFQTPLRVFSSDGKLMGEFGEKRRDPIDIADIPTPLINAVLAAEDDRFYYHSGVSIKSLLRAASQLLTSGHIKTGGSTITMQVARNFFLTRAQTFSRKFNEILLALKIEQELSKQEILELYFNKIYFGNRAYGVSAAAQVYYGKHVNELSLSQITMIAGLPKAPSSFNPIANPARALIRRNWILGRMKQLGHISQEELDDAIKQPISATYHGQKLDINAPYVAEIARDKAVELFGDAAYTDGYKIITSIDSRLQKKAQQALIKGLSDYDQRHGYRGPEKQLDPAKLSALDTTATATEATTQLGSVNLIPWVDTLKRTPSYGGIEPAIVIGIVDNKHIQVLLKDTTTATVLWENGLKQAKRYINENVTGKSPKKPTDVVSIGDLIRVQKADSGELKFTQLPAAQGALVSINPNDGAIRALVGGFDFNQSSFNRVIQAKRQPGSNFKPFIYAVGLENGLSPASIFNDAPIVVEDRSLEDTWRPENSSGKFFGPTRLRKALYLSRNLISIRLLRYIGIQNAIKGIERFGIKNRNLPKDLSMALGSHIMTPLEVATGYSVFANNGYQIEPFLIEEIQTREGDIAFQAEPFVADSRKLEEAPTSQLAATTADDSENNTDTEVTQITPAPPAPFHKSPRKTRPAPRVLDRRVTYIMNSILRDVITRGTASRAKTLNRNDLAGKTGTTNGPTDAWFSGFNQHLVTTTWVGFDNNKKLGRREYGGSAALPIWIDFMRTALDGVPETLPPQPNGIVTVRINPETGERAHPNDPNGIFEIFRAENAPDELPLGSGSHYIDGSEAPPPEELF